MKTETIQFEIPYPPTKQGKTDWNKRFGLNAYYSGKNYHARKRAADELHDITIWSMKKAGIRKKPLKRPVTLHFLFNDNMDCSNHAIIVKMVEDAMKGFIIEDDNRKHVKAITVSFHDENCIRVIVQEVC